MKNHINNSIPFTCSSGVWANTVYTHARAHIQFAKPNGEIRRVLSLSRKHLPLILLSASYTTSRSFNVPLFLSLPLALLSSKSQVHLTSLGAGKSIYFSFIHRLSRCWAALEQWQISSCSNFIDLYFRTFASMMSTECLMQFKELHTHNFLTENHVLVNTIEQKTLALIVSESIHHNYLHKWRWNKPETVIAKAKKQQPPIHHIAYGG